MENKEFMNQKACDMSQEELVKALTLKIKESKEPAKPEGWIEITNECNFISENFSGEFCRVYILHKGRKIAYFPSKNTQEIIDIINDTIQIEYDNVNDFKILKKV